MKQQTSVEWLVDEIEKHYITNIGTLDPTIVMELRRQAKEMEKERIINAYKMGKYEHDKIVMSDTFYAEQYYNETYGGEK
jgi:hypothetical protein